jgi:hypothetical protein
VKGSDRFAIGIETSLKSGVGDGREKTWDLPPSMRDDFAQHDPVSMFPDADASSTIPDNTFTQKRLIEEALSVKQIVIKAHSQTQASACSEFSIPWSDSTQGVSQYDASAVKLS